MMCEMTQVNVFSLQRIEKHKTPGELELEDEDQVRKESRREGRREGGVSCEEGYAPICRKGREGGRERGK